MLCCENRYSTSIAHKNSRLIMPESCPLKLLDARNSISRWMRFLPVSLRRARALRAVSPACRSLPSASATSFAVSVCGDGMFKFGFWVACIRSPPKGTFRGVEALPQTPVKPLFTKRGLTIPKNFHCRKLTFSEGIYCFTFPMRQHRTIKIFGIPKTFL